MEILFVNEAKVDIHEAFSYYICKLHDKTCLQTTRYACSFIMQHRGTKTISPHFFILLLKGNQKYKYTLIIWI